MIHWKTKYLSIKHKAHPPATAQRGLLKYVRSCHLHAVYSEITALLRMKSKVWIRTSHKVLHGLVLADSAHNTYLLPLIDSLLAWKKPSELLYRTLHLSFQQTSNISTSAPSNLSPWTQDLPALLLPHFSSLLKFHFIRILIYPPILHLHPLPWPLSTYFALFIDLFLWHLKMFDTLFV